MTDPDTTILTSAEEIARIDKRDVLTGRVRVETRVETTEEMVRARLDADVVEVERVPVDKVVTEIPSVRTEGDVTIVPIVEEILVVEKRLVLKEELRIHRRTETEEVEVPVTLRRQTAEVLREAIDSDSNVKET